MTVRYLLLLVLCLLLCPSVRAQKTEKKTPTLSEKVKPMELRDGYFPMYWSAEEGKVYLVIDRFDEDFLYVNSLAAGLGSNDIGLDRNQLGRSRVVQFKRVGPKVLLQQRNLDYRAVSDNPDEAASVADAFAQSVLHGFKVAAEEGDRVLIDLTPLLMTDAHDVIPRLKRGKQGTFKIDASRSSVYLDRTKNFPKNSEFEALITFTGQATGSQLRSVTPTPGSFSLRMHHSFVELPDDDYTPRVFDPRSGYGALRYADYATPIDQPLVKRFIRRHRLEKQNPLAEVSEPVEPIVYYLDRGAPEPIKSALLEGASWWDEAFAAAGYKNAFRVEVLPEGADPLDVRYNVINWVHRSTRGWSYGSSVTDPRTGEIIKGHVLLGSLRVRQDFLLAQGLIAAYADGETPDPRLEEMALARLRQLSAHEVGHTLGLAHNFAASLNERASVMDYPHPYVQLKDGKVDLSEAYATGIGEWDKRTILYGYQDFADGTDEDEALNNILDANTRLGLFYLSDPDARPAGSSQPQAHLWDNGADATVEMQRISKLRSHALENFGVDNLAPGIPLSELEKVLVPVYLMHRFQVEAVAKKIAGYHYDYAVRGSYDEAKVRPVSFEEQDAAFSALMATVQPEALMVPERVAALIPPPAMGYGRDRESFKTTNGGGFDPLAMARAATDNTLKFLLHPHRLARVVEQNARFPDSYRTLPGYLKTVENGLAATDGSSSMRDELAAMVRRRYVDHLIMLAAGKDNAESVRAAALERLDERSRDSRLSTYLLHRIDRFLDNPTTIKPAPDTPLPDGSPIGSCGPH